MTISEKDLQEMIKYNPSLKQKLEKQLKKQQKKVKENLPSSEPRQEEENIEKSKKKNKYRNVKVYEYASGLISYNKNEIDAGKILFVYDSIKEYKRWRELLILQQTGKIQELKRQIRLIIQESFTYHDKRIRAIEYVADFFYIKDGKTIVEDVKPFDVKADKYRLTKDFSLKWKLLKYRYPDYYFEIF